MKRRFALYLTFLLFLTAWMAGCNSSSEPPDSQTAAAGSFDSAALSPKGLTVSFIDVGQGDSSFIELPNGETMLIDAGEPQCADTVISYIESRGFDTIDYVVGTHPHSDHIGGLPEVIRHFNVGSVYLPKVQNTTQIFENLLTAISDKGLKIKTAAAGTVILDSDALTARILAPGSESYSDLNNYSAVIKLTYGSDSFLFTGDAEAESERQLTSDYSAEVLKVGHHGSSYSTTDPFLSGVSPKYAVISCGKGNSYGHPASDTLQRLTAAGTEVYRTDEAGTILIHCDGASGVQVASQGQSAAKVPGASSNQASGTVAVQGSTQGSSAGIDPATTQPPEQANPAPKDPAAAAPAPPATTPPVAAAPPANTTEETVYITETGSKYHSEGCQYLRQSKIPISLSEARADYSPCSKCNPTQ